MANLVATNHETGDLSQYDSTATDGGDLSVETAAGLAGTGYGLQAVIDDTTQIYGHKGFTWTTDYLRWRVYADLSGLTMANNDAFSFMWFERDGVSNNDMWLTIRWSASLYQINLLIQADGGSESTDWYTIDNTVPHFYECRIQRATSGVALDGEMQMIIDNSVAETKTGLDIFDVARPDVVRLGAGIGIEAGTSGTIFSDELIINDDNSPIGPLGTSVGGGNMRMAAAGGF
jgi:hypothetical protein